MEVFTITAAFVLGLAHTLEPCEDKVIVSILTVWGSKKWKDSIPLVILYGLGMTLINTLLGIVFIYLGAEVLEGLEKYIAIIAGVIFISFGVFMFWGKHFPKITGILHHHTHQHERGEICVFDKIERKSKKHFFDKTKRNVLLAGFIRGLPYCPIETAVVLWAVSTGRLLDGAAIIFTFGIATTVGLIPIGLLFGTIAQKTKDSKYGKYAEKLCSLAIIIVGAILLILTIFGIGLDHHIH